MKKLLILGIAMAFASAAFAYPLAISPNGFTGTATTGGFQVPTSDTAKGITVAMDRFEGEFSEWPNTQLLWGVMPNLEVGAGYFKQESTTWNIDGKFALPIDLAGGKLAVGAGYAKNQTFDEKIWDVYLAGTWTVMGDLKFTGNIYYSKFTGFMGDDSNTDFLAAIAKPFANGAELGAELDLNPPADQGVFGNVYYTFPVNDSLSARVALAGLGPAAPATAERHAGEESPGSIDIRCRITSGGGNPRDSATENEPLPPS